MSVKSYGESELISGEHLQIEGLFSQFDNVLQTGVCGYASY